jgi:MFS transporter, AAHS family, 4-hydroxybenzoate transporter
MTSIEPRALTVNELIDGRPPSAFQVAAIVLCGFVILFDGFDAQSLGFLVPFIAEEFGVPRATFGPALSASLFGLMIGAMVAGPIADRWGRKSAIISSVVVFGLMSLLTARAASLNELVALRFLTGLGLGGAMPNAVSLASEYAPKRLQAMFVSAIFVGMAGGAVVAITVAAVLIPVWGWRSVFVVGGLLPLVLAVLLLVKLPESLRFLASAGADRARMAAIVRRIAPEAVAATLAPPPSERLEGLPLAHLFTDGRAVGTVLLWIPFFMNLLIIYFIVQWLPSLLVGAGMAASAGLAAVAAFSIGGIIGSLLQGPLMKKFGVYTSLVVEFVAALGLVVVVAQVFASFELMLGVTFFLGISVQAAQAGLNALAAMYYPTAMRSTGVGWAVGVGRVGSIVGPLIGSVMLELEWTPREIFLAGAVPALISAATVVVSGWLQGRKSPYRSEAQPVAVPGPLIAPTSMPCAPRVFSPGAASEQACGSYGSPVVRDRPSAETRG